jgi:hypothetical protein
MLPPGVKRALVGTLTFDLTSTYTCLRTAGRAQAPSSRARFTLYAPLRHANLALEQNDSFYLAVATISRQKRERGDPVQSDPVSERCVLCQDRTVLGCRCGERLILLGREEDWYCEGRTTFECHHCGGPLSLADMLDEGRGPNLIGSSDMSRGFDQEDMSVRDLIRSLKASGQ